ncbi:MAG: V-type ATPase subunit [Natrialbaceae archaeon]|nr:V-type ATPase subunit [Natrialbaceae archaeon]
MIDCSSNERTARARPAARTPEYVNARVRSRRAALFDEDDYRKLVRMGPSEIARFMEDTEYEAEINALGARHSGVDLIEYALNRNLAKHFHDLLAMVRRRASYDQIARYLRKFDAWNVKTVIRGVYTDADSEAIRDRPDPGRRVRRRACSIGSSTPRSIEEVVERARGTTLRRPAGGRASRTTRTDGVLVPLENAVDRAF